MKKLLLLICLFCFQNYSSAQAYEGGGMSMVNFGYGFSDNNYLAFGMNYGWSDYVSTGMSFYYYPGIETTDFGDTMEESFGVGLEARLNIHASNMFDMGKSDVRLGYFYRLVSGHGAQLSYDYYLTESMALYVKPRYVFSKSVDYFEEANFNVEFGILFSFESPWGGATRTF